MTAVEWLSEQIEQYSIQVRHEIAKEFATKCTDELIKEIDNAGLYTEYWQVVKQEIEKL